jgi:hypothetical protein
MAHRFIHGIDCEEVCACFGADFAAIFDVANTIGDSNSTEVVLSRVHAAAQGITIT